MALYAGGGPALLVHLFVMIAMYCAWRASGKLNLMEVHASWAIALSVGVGASFTIFVTTLSAALAGLHARDGIRSRHIVAANVFAFLVTGLLFAMLQPAGTFGLHLVLGPTHDAGRWHFGVGLAD